MIDAVVVPEDADAVIEPEVMISKFLQEVGSSDMKEHKSSAKGVIDTRAHKGDLSRYFPNKGTFRMIHFDMGGKGGLALIIDDARNLRHKALMMVAEALLSHCLFSIRQALSRE